MKKTIIDHSTLQRTLRRMAYEIIEKTKELDGVVLLGIKQKGVCVAEILQDNIERIEGIKVPQYGLDITPFRDDVKTDVPTDINNAVIDIDLTDKIVILVDDVLYTGRTIRAAMDAVIELGRPERIELAILVDRGHRQLPIRANYVGKNIPTASDEKVVVHLSDLSEKDCVEIIK